MIDQQLYKKLKQAVQAIGTDAVTSPQRVAFLNKISEILHITVDASGQTISMLSQEEYVSEALYAIIAGKKLPDKSLLSTLSIKECQELAQQLEVEFTPIKDIIDLATVQNKYPSVYAAAKKSIDRLH